MAQKLSQDKTSDLVGGDESTPVTKSELAGWLTKLECDLDILGNIGAMAHSVTEKYSSDMLAVLERLDGILYDTQVDIDDIQGVGLQIECSCENELVHMLAALWASIYGIRSAIYTKPEEQVIADQDFIGAALKSLPSVFGPKIEAIATKLLLEDREREFSKEQVEKFGSLSLRKKEIMLAMGRERVSKEARLTVDDLWTSKSMEPFISPDEDGSYIQSCLTALKQGGYLRNDRQTSNIPGYWFSPKGTACYRFLERESSMTPVVEGES